MDDDNAEEGSDLLEENYYTFLNLSRTVSQAEKYYAIPLVHSMLTLTYGGRDEKQFF